MQTRVVLRNHEVSSNKSWKWRKIHSISAYSRNIHHKIEFMGKKNHKKNSNHHLWYKISIDYIYKTVFRSNDVFLIEKESANPNRSWEISTQICGGWNCISELNIRLYIYFLKNREEFFPISYTIFQIHTKPHWFDIQIFSQFWRNVLTTGLNCVLNILFFYRHKQKNTCCKRKHSLFKAWLQK